MNMAAHESYSKGQKHGHVEEGDNHVTGVEEDIGSVTHSKHSLDGGEIHGPACVHSGQHTPDFRGTVARDTLDAISEYQEAKDYCDDDSDYAAQKRESLRTGITASESASVQQERDGKRDHRAAEKFLNTSLPGWVDKGFGQERDQTQIPHDYAYQVENQNGTDLCRPRVLSAKAQDRCRRKEIYCNKEYVAENIHLRTGIFRV